MWRETPNLRRFARRTVIVVVTIVAVFVAARIVGHVRSSNRLEREMARFRALGGSTRLADLAPAPYSGPGINPAQYLEAAGLIAPSFRGANVSVEGPGLSSFDYPDVTDARKIEVALGQYENSTAGQTFITVTQDYSRYNTDKRFEWNDAWLPWLEKYLAQSPEALSLTRKGAAGEGGVFQVDWAAVRTTSPPNHMRLREAARLLLLSAVVRAHRGDIDGAMDDVRLGLRLRRPLNNEPSVGSKYIAYMLDSKALSSIQAVLDAGRPSREAIEAVLKELEGREQDNRLTLQLLGEAARGVGLFERLRDGADAYAQLRGTPGEQGATERWLTNAFFSLIWVGPADESAFLAVMNDQIENSSLPYPDILAGPGAYPPFGRWADVTRLPFTVVTRLSTEGLQRHVQQEAYADTRVRLARSVLALTLYQMDNGAYPETLLALAPKYLPEVQTDPFTGKELLYQLRDKGFVVYSTGSDGFDNGGVWGGAPDAGGADITWERGSAPEARYRL